MTFNCHMMLNIDGLKKIPLPRVNLLLSFAVYRDAYLDTNPKIAIRFSEAIPTPTDNVFFFFRVDRIQILLKSGHHQPARETPFKWYFAGVPMMAQR